MNIFSKEASVPKPKFKLSIRTFLILVISVMVSAPVLISTYFSFRYGAKSTKILIMNSIDVLNSNIQEEISDFFEIPDEINNMNQNLILGHLLDEKNQSELMTYFHEQIKTHNKVSSITFANKAGGIANAGIDHASKQYYVIYTEKFERGVFNKYALDSNGKMTELITQLPDFDARIRPWYKNALNHTGIVWSDPYLMATGNNLGINASMAIRDHDNQLLGVVCVDLFLSDLSKFLARLDLGKGAQTYIMEKSGMLIASSNNDKLFNLDSENHIHNRIDALVSESEIIRTTSTQLKRKYIDFSNINHDTNFDITIEDEAYLVQVKPFSVITNQQWLIVTVVPKITYMAKVYANNQILIFIMIIILIVSILFSLRLSRMVSQPILSLDKKVRAISQGDWSSEPIQSRILEIDDLAVETFKMKTTIKSTIEALNNEISERKQTETILQDIIDNNPMSIQIVDKEGYTIQVNAAHTQLFGLVPPPDYCLFNDMFIEQQDQKGLMERAKKGEIIHLPIMYYNIHNVNPEYPDNPIWVKAVIFPLNGSDGNPERYVFMHDDITKIKQAERLIIENAERYKVLAEQSRTITWEVNAEGLFTYVTPVIEQILGYSPSEIVNKFHFYDFHPEEGRDLFQSAAFEVFTRKESIQNLLNAALSKTGELVWFHTNVVPIIGKDGELLGFKGSNTDITERIHMEEENIRIQNQFNQSHKMELLGQLAGGVAHDFNNLLTVIMGYSEELRSNLPPQSQNQKEAAEIFKAGSRAKELTQQLLSFSRKQVIQAKVLDLNALVANLQSIFLRLIKEDIQIVSIPSKESALVKADHGQIEQVITNLVLNSRDAMPNGGKITISTAVIDDITAVLENFDQVKPGKYVLLSVSDTGYGMSPSVQSKIFEPFFTTKDKGNGLGLGLSTVYGIVLQSEGHIFVDSEQGKGTTVKILFPITKETLPSEQDPSNGRDMCGNGENVLIVEDEELLANFFKEMVSKLGYNVIVVNSGTEAISKLENGFKPDLIITDVIMPGMNGKELADRIRQIVPDQKVLFMSGFTDNIIVPYGVLDYGIPFIQKPFSAKEIAGKMKTLLSPPPKQNGNSFRVLMLDDDENILLLAKRAFIKRGNEFIGVCNLKNAMLELSKGNFDVLLIDINLVSMTGMEALQSIRDAGYHMPAIAISGMLNLSLVTEMQALGVVKTMEKSSDMIPLIYAAEEAIKGS